MLKVGELAKRSGLTVRALHHYDSIGLLQPSARSDAGYRLYNRDDIARLHQIQALRRFGVSLSDIATVLANPGSELATIVDRQIAALTEQIAQANDLRGQLRQLQRQLAAGEEPALATWLTTLEMMTMYDQYFSKDEQARMPMFNRPASATTEWPAMVARMQAAMDAGTPPQDPQVQQLAQHWMTMFERDTAGNADFASRIREAHDAHPEMRAQSGITPPLLAYVNAATRESKFAVYDRYLTAEESAFMRANFGLRAHEWPELVAEVRRAIDAGVTPKDSEAQTLAARWMDLFRSYAGDNPDTQRRFREAHENEPALMVGTFVTEDMLDFIREALIPPRA